MIYGINCNQVAAMLQKDSDELMKKIRKNVQCYPFNKAKICIFYKVIRENVPPSSPRRRLPCSPTPRTKTNLLESVLPLCSRRRATSLTRVVRCDSVDRPRRRDGRNCRRWRRRRQHFPPTSWWPARKRQVRADTQLRIFFVRSSARPLLRKCRTGCLDRIHLYSDISRWNEFDSDFEPFGIVTAGYNIPEFLKQFSL